MNLLLPLLLVSNLHIAAQAEPASPRPMDLWKNGEMLNLSIEVPGQTSFISHVVTSNLEAGKGGPGWQLTFIPGDKAPASLKGRCRVLVDPKTGKSTRAIRLPDNKEIALETIGPITFIIGAPEAMPLEWFASFEPAEARVDGEKIARRISIRKEEEGSFVHVTMTLREDNIEVLRVWQKWVPGEKWWREYERDVKGKKNLIARLLNPPVLKEVVAAKQKPIDEWGKFVKAHPLGRDVKLHSPVLCADENPTLSTLLDRLREKTGLQFTVAENLIYHEPELADLHRKHELVYTYMEILATRDLDNGRWEKTDGGYRLEGNSRALRPPPRNYGWVWIAGSALLLCVALAGGGAFFVFRRRGTNSIATPSKAQPATPVAKKSRRGYTLIEVLVVLAIVAILIGLLAVGIVKIRASAANTACQNNLKQLGIACHAANTQHRRMPPAFGFYPFDNDITSGFNGLGNTFFHLLPFLDQQTLYEESRFKPKSKPQQYFHSYTANGVHQKQVAVFNCPSDPTLMPGINPATQYAPSSYAGNYLVFGTVNTNFVSASAYGRPQLVGATFKDGASKTILFAEKYASAFDSTYVGGCHWAYFQADCQIPFFAYVDPPRKNIKSFTDPNAVGLSGMFQVQPKAAGGCDPCLPATGHTAMNVCMADGSVRSLSASISAQTWWALVTPASGDKPGDWE
jgi:prepilin-type N-terminal cleavage/methylation domain-containing protein